MDGCLAWLRDTLGLCVGLSSVELELDFTFVMREAGMRGVDSEQGVAR